MLKIAVCDDRPEELTALKNHIDRYALENAMPVEVRLCSDPKDILKTLSHAGEYDCLFLDIYMESLNGIDIARQLRRRGTKSRIVFFSTSTEHALEAFGVNALQYLVKPVKYDDLANAMDIVLEHKKEQESAISITTGSAVPGGIRRQLHPRHTIRRGDHWSSAGRETRPLHTYRLA